MAPNRKEQTFIMVKPDGVERGLINKIIKRFEQRGYKLVAMKFVQASEDLLLEHYSSLSHLPFYRDLVAFIGSSPVVAMVWEGLDIVKQGRLMMGETKPCQSAPGTIRGTYCIDISRNIIHGSDSVESAIKEISLWFRSEEIIDWTPSSHPNIYE
ncbi:putative nucleoside diphosphate kinase [Cardiosporidium cionae]|uniref:Nucleoside diphosphate kinase n=1 Tax=Cardiosporidium cionae TaxID=476202 RepID=A0ABQ7JD09_9APIC|nr:putative nucleoside diphosphate kinase [Cardiosporidium cionae]|eukprot:KAF8821907.1 putative nucleoside diphosphate kinase [Cardiosporidium cionae]